MSIVSHGHGAMVAGLVEQLLACPEVGQVIVTYNVPEQTTVFSDHRVEVIVNRTPQGFGANHNAAFRRCREAFWGVLNPDIELTRNPFPDLLDVFKDESVGLAAPLVMHPSGGLEDSIRLFPTLTALLGKLMGCDNSRYAVLPGRPMFCPEWVAGMFMLFRASSFAALRGFDEGYYLYYEDVDICWRAWRMGKKVVACPSASVIHDARRASRGNWQHRRWHLASMLRFLARSFMRRPKVSDFREA